MFWDVWMGAGPEDKELPQAKQNSFDKKWSSGS